MSPWLDMGSYFVRMKRTTSRKLFQLLPGLQDPYKTQKYANNTKKMLNNCPVGDKSCPVGDKSCPGASWLPPGCLLGQSRHILAAQE